MYRTTYHTIAASDTCKFLLAASCKRGHGYDHVLHAGVGINDNTLTNSSVTQHCCAAPKPHVACVHVHVLYHQHMLHTYLC